MFRDLLKFSEDTTYVSYCGIQYQILIILKLIYCCKAVDFTFFINENVHTLLESAVCFTKKASSEKYGAGYSSVLLGGG